MSANLEPLDAEPGAPAFDPAPGGPRHESLFAAIWSVLRSPVPPGRGGLFAFGWLVLLLFLSQLVTGILLSFYYEPSHLSAASSVRFLTRDVSYGWLVRGLHHWSATFFVALALIQLVRVLAVHAYRRGGAVSWYLGLILLGLVLLLSFTGTLLLWDAEAYWTTRRTLELVESMPAAGPLLASLLRGGSEVGGQTLSRVYALHVLFLPGIALVVTTLNLWILARRGEARGE